ncbi:MAG: iron complex transport system permease protein, partial [Humisphaera sp.]|nr:iron complex transport system permease protein [Humisphaera sp.]
LTLLFTIAFCAFMWAIVAFWCMMIASTGYGWPATHEILLIRGEVVLLSSLVGAALAAAGVTYQAILRNPLADPYLLGVSSGAALFAYLWRLPALTGIATLLGAASQQGFAFAGALIAVFWVLAFASRRGRLEPVTVLLVGVIINALNGSIFLLVYSLVSTLPSSEGALTLLVGGIQTGLTPQQIRAACVVIALGWIILLAISGQLNAAGVGDVEAEALGVRIQRLRWIALVVASLVTASAVAISGPIGFIGLICPHLARLFVGTDQRRLLPVSTAFGAGLLCAADAVSRRLAGEGLAQTLLPVGVLTSLLGGPFFLLLLIRNRRRADVMEGRI